MNDAAYRATHPPRPCTEHRWVETRRYGDRHTVGRCTVCGLRRPLDHQPEPGDLLTAVEVL